MKKIDSHGLYYIGWDHPPTPWQYVDWTHYQLLPSPVEVCMEDLLVEQQQPPYARHCFRLMESLKLVQKHNID